MDYYYCCFSDDGTTPWCAEVIKRLLSMAASEQQGEGWLRPSSDRKTGTATTSRLIVSRTVAGGGHVILIHRRANITIS